MLQRRWWSRRFSILLGVGVSGWLSCKEPKSQAFDWPVGTAFAVIGSQLLAWNQDKPRQLAVCPQEDKGTCHTEPWFLLPHKEIRPLLTWTQDQRNLWQEALKPPASQAVDCPTSLTDKLRRLPSYHKPIRRLRPPPTLLIASHPQGYTLYLQGRALSQGCHPERTAWIASPILPTIPHLDPKDAVPRWTACLRRLRAFAPEEVLLTVLVPRSSSWPALHTALEPLRKAASLLSPPPAWLLAPLEAFQEPSLPTRKP